MAVDFKPICADQVLLIEDCIIGAEEVEVLKLKHNNAAAIVGWSSTVRKSAPQNRSPPRTRTPARTRGRVDRKPPRQHSNYRTPEGKLDKK